MKNNDDEFLSLFEIRSLSPTEPFSYVERPTFTQAPFWCLVHTALLLLVFGTLFGMTPKNPYAVLAVLSLSLLSFTAVFVRYLYDARAAGDSYRLTNDFIEVESGRVYREARCIPWSHVQSVSSRVSLFQRRFGTGDIILHLAPTFSAVETSASLALGASGSLSHRATRGESVMLRDVEHMEVKKRLVRELISAQRSTAVME